jgi:hypothetical protein
VWGGTVQTSATDCLLHFEYCDGEDLTLRCDIRLLGRKKLHKRPAHIRIAGSCVCCFRPALLSSRRTIFGCVVLANAHYWGKCMGQRSAVMFTAKPHGTRGDPTLVILAKRRGSGDQSCLTYGLCPKDNESRTSATISKHKHGSPYARTTGLSRTLVRVCEDDGIFPR